MTAAVARAEHADEILRAEGLTRRFGGLVAVSDFSFAMRRGEILGLIGPNGAGKSTTFNLLSGFIAPSAGRLWFDGLEISGKKAPAISRLGLVRMFQHNSLIKDMSVYENIFIATLVGLRSGAERDRRVRETAEIFHLSADLAELGGSLSHGSQRLLAMAIATAGHPKLLCLDEPLTGLNSTEIKDVLAIFQRLRREFGISILLVEHNMRAVMNVCDRVVVMHHGQLLAEGSPQQISQDERVVTAYLGRRA